MLNNMSKHNIIRVTSSLSACALSGCCIEWMLARISYLYVLLVLGGIGDTYWAVGV